MTKQGRKSYSLQPILLLSPHSCKQVIVLAGSPYSTNCSHLTAQYFQTIQLLEYQIPPVLSVRPSQKQPMAISALLQFQHWSHLCNFRVIFLKFLMQRALRWSHGLSAWSQAGLRSRQLEVWALRCLIFTASPLPLQRHVQTENRKHVCSKHILKYKHWEWYNLFEL